MRDPSSREIPCRTWQIAIGDVVAERPLGDEAVLIPAALGPKRDEQLASAKMLHELGLAR